MPTFDLVIVVGFLVLLLGVGVFPGRTRGREAFLISDRRLGGVSSGFTIGASKIGGGLLVTYSTLVFAFGHQAIWLFVGFVTGYALFYGFARKLHIESHERRYYTMADYFESHFGRTAGMAIGIACVVSLAGWILTNLIAGGELVGRLTGISPAGATILMTIPMAVYLIWGGYHSVVRTDLVQFVALIGILILILFSIFNLDQAAASVPAPASVEAAKGPPLIKILSFFLAGALFPMGSAELWQRAYSARSERSLLTAIVIASAAYLLVGIALSFVCLKLRVIVLDDQSTAAGLGLVNGVATVIGTGLAGLWVVAFLSAILSSADTFVFTTSSALIEDVAERAGWTSCESRVTALRWAIFGFCLFGCLGAVFFRDIVHVTFYFVGITMAIGVVAISAWLAPKPLSGPVIAVALLAGTVAATIQVLVGGVSELTAAVNGGVALLVLAVMPRIFPPGKSAAFRKPS